MRILVIGREGRLAKYTPAEKMAEHTFRYVPIEAGDDEIRDAYPEADIVIVDAIGRLSASVIFQLKNLKMIHSEGVGYNGVDVQAASSRGIPVCNCKAANADSVAEQSVLLMLGLLRHIRNGDRAVRAGRQIDIKEDYMLTGSVRELGECTVGLVGFGDIAKALARILYAFGSKILYNNRHGEIRNEWGAEYRVKEALIRESDIVSIHLPSAPDTYHIADKSFFSLMRKDSILINTARGELVDSKALVEAIGNGRIAGAGLDCIEGEPVKENNELLVLSRNMKVNGTDETVADRLLLSPHIGGITGAAFSRSYGMIWENIDRVDRGERPVRIVNRL